MTSSATPPLGYFKTVAYSGYAFPAYHGGQMWYADTVGLAKIYQKILEFEKLHGELWRPAPLLKRLAESGGTFAGQDASKA